MTRSQLKYLIKEVIKEANDIPEPPGGDDIRGMNIMRRIHWRKARLASLGDFTRSFIETALLTSMDSNGQPLYYRYSINNFAPHTINEIVVECNHFQNFTKRLYSNNGWTDEQA